MLSLLRMRYHMGHGFMKAAPHDHNCVMQIARGRLHVQVAVRAGGAQLAEGRDAITCAQNGRTLAAAPTKPAKKGAHLPPVHAI